MRPILLILIPGFPKDEQDSTTLPFVQSFIRTLNKNYAATEVIVVAMDYPYSKTQYTWFGNRVIPLNGDTLKPRPLLWIRLYRILRSYYRQKRLIGVLNFWCADNALVTHVFSKFNNLQHYTWLQGQDARRLNRALWFFKPESRHLIALSDFLSGEFQKNHSVKPAHIIPPGIDVQYFDMTPVAKTIDIIGVGSLSALKQYDRFLEVIAKLKKKFPQLKAMIVGKGPEETTLREKIRECGLASNVEMKGELGHGDTLRLMAASKILLHPSSYEGYGVACLEALAAGCHVISFVSPEKNSIPHWHIVTTPEEMTHLCMEVLLLPGDSFFPVVPHRIEDVVEKIMDLYGHREQKVYVVPSTAGSIAL